MNDGHDLWQFGGRPTSPAGQPTYGTGRYGVARQFGGVPEKSGGHRSAAEASATNVSRTNIYKNINNTCIRYRICIKS